MGNRGEIDRRLYRRRYEANPQHPNVKGAGQRPGHQSAHRQPDERKDDEGGGQNRSLQFPVLEAVEGFAGLQSGTVKEEQDEDEDGDTMLDDGYCRPSGRKHRSNDRRHHDGEDEPVNR